MGDEILRGKSHIRGFVHTEFYQEVQRCFVRVDRCNGLGKDISVSEKIRVVYISTLIICVVEDGLKYMFVMFELMTVMFIVLFCSVTKTNQDIEQIEKGQFVIEQLEREILDAEQQLRYLDMLQKSLQDFKE